MTAPDFDSAVNEAATKNAEIVETELASGNVDLLDKIRRYVARHSVYHELYVRRAISRDHLFASQFAKDPKKQNVYEKCALDFLASIPGFGDIKKLPSGPPNSMHLIQGNVLPASALKSSQRATKSIDFYWTFRVSETISIQVYASHKYTGEGGGAQDNQRVDLEHSLDQARGLDPKIMFLAIADGNYYKAHIPRIRRVCAKNVWILPSSEVEQYIYGYGQLLLLD